MSIALLSTKLPSETAFPSDMIGHSRTRHPTAAVDNHLVLALLWREKHEASQQLDIMKWEISLPHYWLKSAMEWQLNSTYNHFLVSPWLIALPLPKTVLDLMSQCMDSGEEDLKRHLLMWGYSTLAPNQIVMVPPYIATMSKKREGNIVSEYATSNMQLSHLHNRWNGTCCNVLQETRINGSRKRRCLLCCDSKLDTMLNKLRTTEVLSNVHQGSKILLTPATECPIDLQLAEGHLN